MCRPSLVSPLAGCHFATSRSCARNATFVLIVVVPPTQRPARKVTSSPFGSGAKRSGQKRSCAAFASKRVKSGARRCGPHSRSSTSRPRCASSPAIDAAARARPDDDDVVGGRSCDPEPRPVLREARRERRVEVDLRPRARRRPCPARRSPSSTPRSRARGRSRTPASAPARPAPRRPAPPPARARRSRRARRRAPAAASRR